MPAKKKSVKSLPARKSARAKHPSRPDLGAPIEGFFSKQSEDLRAILDALRKLIDDVVPDAQSSLKWGMPFYSLDGKMVCGLSAHKSHVNLILAGPPGAMLSVPRPAEATRRVRIVFLGLRHSAQPHLRLPRRYAACLREPLRRAMLNSDHEGANSVGRNRETILARILLHKWPGDASLTIQHTFGSAP
jgi:hypothetical protein